VAPQPTARPLGDLVIRPADPGDLTTLADVMGDREFFDDRISRQLDERGLLLTAWEDGQVVGDVYLWWEPADEDEVREHKPGVPVLNHLQVVAGRRNLGIGTRLVRAAEQLLRDRRHEQVVLAVELDNVGAARLYDRLGFRDWNHGQVICYSDVSLPDGTRKSSPEVCYMLTKRLTGDR
jgi:predicted N-acetyltransferase YhbS